MHSKLLDKIPNLSYTFTTRDDGSFRLSANASKMRAELRNGDAVKKLDNIRRRLKLEKLKAGIAGFGDRVEVVTDKTPVITEGIDGLISPTRGQGIGLTFADCVPIFIATDNMVGLAHLSWRNTLSHLIKNITFEFSSRGVEPGSVVAVIGPCICPKHFVVSGTTASQFRKKYSDYVKQVVDDGYEVDLRKINKQILIDNGFAPNNIEIIDECTYCEKDMYFSYRREFYKQKGFPVQLAAIGFRK